MDARVWLAQVDQRDGPQSGRYLVSLNDLANVGVSAIDAAVENADVVVIDEVGPMEFFSNRFSARDLARIAYPPPFNVEDLLLHEDQQARAKVL